MFERFDIYFDEKYIKDGGDFILISEDCDLLQIEHHITSDAHQRNLKGHLDLSEIGYMYKLFRKLGIYDELGIEEVESCEVDDIFTRCDECETYVLCYETYNGYCEYCQDEEEIEA